MCKINHSLSGCIKTQGSNIFFWNTRNSSASNSTEKQTLFEPEPPHCEKQVISASAAGELGLTAVVAASSVTPYCELPLDTLLEVELVREYWGEVCVTQIVLL